MKKKTTILLTAILLLGSCTNEVLPAADPTSPPQESGAVPPSIESTAWTFPEVHIDENMGELIPGDDYGLLLPYQTEDGDGLMTKDGFAVTGAVYDYVTTGYLHYPPFYLLGRERQAGDPFYSETEMDGSWWATGPFALASGTGEWVTEQIYYTSRESALKNPYGFLVYCSEDTIALLNDQGEEVWRQHFVCEPAWNYLDDYIMDGDCFWASSVREEILIYEKRSFATGEILEEATETPKESGHQSENVSFPFTVTETVAGERLVQNEAGKVVYTMHSGDQLSFLRDCISGKDYFSVTNSLETNYYFNESGVALIQLENGKQLENSVIYALLGFEIGEEGAYLIGGDGRTYFVE